VSQHEGAAIGLHKISGAAPARAAVEFAARLPSALFASGLVFLTYAFGVRWFGRYVLSIRDFPPGGARYVRSVTHEVLRSVVGRVSVAEVDGEQWRISDRENTLELPVSPSRVNLWRLMAHAVATIDLRPPGPFGRETIESMLLGTPVVVPDASAAMEHAAAADGGLWYRDVGELFDATRVLMYRPVRDRLAAQGRAYADAKHGQVDDFVARVGRIVLGDGVA